MKTSESIIKIAPALLRAQRKIGGAVKGAANPFFKSKYADLGAVMEACKEALNEEGILVLQPVISEDAVDYVETVLVHESGEYISSRMRIIVSKQDMQAYGSSISYARRYGLQSLVFIPAEDDDGEKSMARQAPRPAIQLAPLKAPPTNTPTSVVKDDRGQETIVESPKLATHPIVETKVIAEAPIAEVPKSRTTFRKPTPTGTPPATPLNF